MNEGLIDIQNLTFEYGTKTNTILALNNINLQIRQGEFICVLGPSGCGKTTLLKIIAGYLKPTSGTCMMHGEPITGPNWHRGVVFQSPTLYPWMNLKENVEFGPRMRGLPGDEIERIRLQFLDQVKLSGFGDKYVFELSGGMKQRGELARALANRPEVILMDEPFGALDALTRMDMQTLIRNIWKNNNSTIFMITHDVDEALSLGTRIMVISNRPGSIIAEFDIGFTHTIFNNPSRHIKCSDDYYNMKDKIIDLIHGQDQ
ncbi:MAG: transporter ATP-binding protein [Clostridiales bacterium]|jgi:taurine transport system ATP-binding protein|nr:transporter ATP-binding protein [Clostridiales bacterium]